MTSKIITRVNPDGSTEKIIKEHETKRNPAMFQYRDYGLYIVIPILLGVFIGIYIDKVFHTKPIATITLLILGTIGTFYNLYKLVKDENATR